MDLLRQLIAAELRLGNRGGAGGGTDILAVRDTATNGSIVHIAIAAEHEERVRWEMVEVPWQMNNS